MTDSLIPLFLFVFFIKNDSQDKDNQKFDFGKFFQIFISVMILANTNSCLLGTVSSYENTNVMKCMEPRIINYC